jgi:hypothetical protein
MKLPKVYTHDLLIKDQYGEVYNSIEFCNCPKCKAIKDRRAKIYNKGYQKLALRLKQQRTF